MKHYTWCCKYTSQQYFKQKRSMIEEFKYIKNGVVKKEDISDETVMIPITEGTPVVDEEDVIDAE